MDCWVSLGRGLGTVFSGFQPSWAGVHIVTPETPMTTIGFGVSLRM